MTPTGFWCDYRPKSKPEGADVLDQVVEELQKRKGEWPGIAHDCRVSYSWICKLAQGRNGNPQFVKLDRVARHLGVVKDEQERTPAETA